MDTPVEELCPDLPKEFATYLKYVRDLRDLGTPVEALVMLPVAVYLCLSILAFLCLATIFIYAFDTRSSA
jgi:hypothetical protein